MSNEFTPKFIITIDGPGTKDLSGSFIAHRVVACIMWSEFTFALVQNPIGFQVALGGKKEGRHAYKLTTLIKDVLENYTLKEITVEWRPLQPEDQSK
jgi:hypothetical protein